MSLSQHVHYKVQQQTTVVPNTKRQTLADSTHCAPHRTAPQLSIAVPPALRASRPPILLPPYTSTCRNLLVQIRRLVLGLHVVSTPVHLARDRVVGNHLHSKPRSPRPSRRNHHPRGPHRPQRRPRRARGDRPPAANERPRCAYYERCRSVSTNEGEQQAAEAQRGC